MDEIFNMNVNKKYFDIKGTTTEVGGIILPINKKNTTLMLTQHLK